MTDPAPQENASSRLARPGMLLRVARVRLRFVVLLLAAGVVVGQWGSVRAVWQAALFRLRGSPHAEHVVSDDTEFFCPMDPGVVSAWPDICPICNMDLVRRKKGEAAVLPEGIVARMQFSPYRVQLAGIKTAAVERRALARDYSLAGRVVLPADTNAHLSGSPPGEGGPAAGPPLLVECPCFASDLAWIAPGRLARIDVDELAAAVSIEARVRSATPGARGGGTILIEPDLSPAWLQRGMTVTVRMQVPLSELEPFKSLPAASTEAGWLAIPASAVVHTGGRSIVYVERMPAMFDGLQVAVGPLCDGYYPVLGGLQGGEKVAVAGAYLIDAEARLNPSLAAAYFGASRAAAESPPGPADPPAQPRRAPSASRPAGRKAALTPAEQAQAAKQGRCPVTGLPLDAMGGPVVVELEGRKVFLCCQGCESKLLSEPQKYLARLNSAKP